MQVDWIAAWSALAGALIGVLGGLITTTMQLRNDRRQRERERVFALRREVFLEFAEAAAKPLIFLSGIPKLEMSLNELNAIHQQTLGPANKLHGVARMETIRALLDSQKYFIECTSKLMRERMELDKFTANISVIQQRLDTLSVHSDQLTTTIHAVSRLPQPDSNRINTLVQMLQNANTESAELHKRRTELVLTRTKRQMALTGEATKYSGEYGRYLARLNVAMRNEMELPLAAEYEQVLMETQREIQEKYNSFAKEIEENMLKDPK